MKPLRDTRDFASESERRVAELLATMPPYEPSPVRKHSLGVKLAASHQRRGLRLLRPIAGVALLFAGTAAAATLGQRLWSEPLEQAEEAPPEVAVARSLPPRAPSRRVVAPAAASKDPEPAPIPPAAEPTKPAKVTKAAPPRQPAAPQKRLARASEDPRPVADALKALRRDQDPARAQSLLNDYLQANPQGALSEEALALSIEAAHTRKDPVAKTHARRYLSRYPAGRHRRLAERVLAE